MNGIKFADEGIIEGLAVPFGSAAKRDRHGEWFDAETDLGLHWFDERPLLLHHGIGSTGTEVIGKVLSVERRPEGIWIRAALDRAGRWFSQVRDLLRADRLGFSSGSMPHLVRTRRDGHIDRWPLVEVSLTPDPASFDARVYSVKAGDALAHFAAVGLPSRALKALVAGDVDLAGIRDRVVLEAERGKFQANIARASIPVPVDLFAERARFARNVERSS